MPRYPTRIRKAPKRLRDDPAFKYPNEDRKPKFCKCARPIYYVYLHLEPQWGEKFDEDRFKSALRCKKCQHAPDSNKPLAGPII
jgi:hypothetical protein